MADNMERYVGCRANFRTKVDGLQVSADIQRIDEENRIITFYQVTVQESGKVFSGLQHYHVNEINDLEITDEVNAALRKACLDKKEVHRNSKKEKSIKHSKETPRHLERMKHFDPEEVLMMKMVDKEMAKTVDEDRVYESKLPDSCTLLNDSKSQLFRDAINHLRQCRIVGVTFKGITMGRNGKLCWILISTIDHTMFFDFETMGKDCLEAGIKDILESPTIMKVIHDCRLPSELLFHQYDVKLVNVFDTQVAAVFVYKLHHGGESPRYVTSLPDCLHSMLQIDKNELYYLMARSHCPQMDEEVWSLRPAPTLVYKWMHQHSRFLLELRERQMEEMLMEYTMGVDIYLQYMRDVNSTEAKARMDFQHLVPTEFMRIPLQMKALVDERKLKEKRVAMKYIATANKDGQGRQENCTGMSHPRVVAHHDSIWHTASYPFNGTRRGTQEKTNKFQGSSQQKQKSSSDKSDIESRKDDSPKSVSHGQNNPAGTKLAADTKGNSGQECFKSGDIKSSAYTNGAPTSTLSDGNALTESTTLDTVNSAAHSADKKMDVEQNEHEQTVALLQQLTKERQEKEKMGISNPHAKMFNFRPAGESMVMLSKKKQRELERQRRVDPGDLAGKSTTFSPQQVELTGNEFDCIPSQKHLVEEYSCRQRSSASTPVFLAVENVSSLNPAGFKTDTFSEIVPPPPYIKQTEGDSQVSAQEALKAILPQVEDQLQLLSGSRSDALYPSQAHAKSPVSFNDESDSKVASDKCSASVTMGKGVDCLKRKQAQFNHCDTERRGSSPFLLDILEKAGRSTASGSPPMGQSGSSCTRSAPVMNGSFGTVKSKYDIMNGRTPTSSSSKVLHTSKTLQNTISNSNQPAKPLASVQASTVDASGSPQGASSNGASSSSSQLLGAGGKSLVHLLGITVSPQERLRRSINLSGAQA